MRAVRVSQFGGPEVLKIESEVPVPKPSKNEVSFNSDGFTAPWLTSSVGGEASPAGVPARKYIVLKFLIS